MVEHFVSSEPEIKVDQDVAAAIDQGIEAADAGRLEPSESVRKLISRWISESSTQSQR